MRTPRLTMVLTLACLVTAIAPAVAAGAAVSGAVAVPATASPSTSLLDGRLSRRVGGSLAFTPSNYVGGQAITFTGRLPVSGVRRIQLQLHMNRPGDSWFGVRGFSAKTAADGSFHFEFPAPSMFGIRYRVVSDGAATTPVTFSAKAQDLTMWVAGSDPAREGAPGQPVADVPFTISVDTTPSLIRRPDTIGAPVFAGRGLTLQRRLDGDTWETLGRSSVDADGLGYFTGVTAPAGQTVYRVVEDAITTGANRIGWMQTFPTYVTVLAPGAPRMATSRSTSTSAYGPMQRNAELTVMSRRQASAAAATTASGKYAWYPLMWDYSWEAGQSLTSPADLGSAPHGWWQDYSDGTGRVSKENGGLYLDSQRNNAAGPGDFGTTRATLTGAGMAYGRWETKLRLKSAESSSPDFKVLVELVPDRLEDYACGRRNITLAEVYAHSGTMRFGVKADTQEWSATRSIPSIINTAPAIAVEVAKGHITWFFDGVPIGTVKSGAAVSDVPMTLRISMVGDQATERNQTGVISDWQRGFSLAHGKQVTSGPSLASTALTTCEA